jgi:hypothetical protein
VNYCSVVCGKASAKIRRLQIAQKKAARIVLKWRYDSSVVVIDDALGWSSINKIIEKKNMLFLFDNVHHLKHPNSIQNEYSVGKGQTFSKY